MITDEMIYEALLFTAIFLTVISMPSVITALRISKRRMAHYRQLRSMENPEPSNTDEWGSINSHLGYSSALMTEIERLNGIRPLLFQIEFSGILLIFLVIVPGFSSEVLPWMLLLIAAMLGSGFLGAYRLTQLIGEYRKLVDECNDGRDKDDLNMIYG